MEEKHYIDTVSGGVEAYDNMIFASDWAKVEDPVKNYFAATNPDSATIYDLIGVGNSTKDPIFEMESDKVDAAFSDDKMINYMEDIQKLIDAKSPVLIYAGEFDSLDGP